MLFIEASKSGTTLAHDSMDGGGRIASGTAIELPDLAAAISLLPNLRLRGLMSIPPPTHDFSGQRQPFQQLREALEQLNRRGLALDTLSMGMSDDMEAAIAEGATLVRIGSAIFGTRQVV